MQINLCEPYLSLPSPFGALIGIVPFLTAFPTFYLTKGMRKDFNMRTYVRLTMKQALALASSRVFLFLPLPSPLPPATKQTHSYLPKAPMTHYTCCLSPLGCCKAGSATQVVFALGFCWVVHLSEWSGQQRGYETVCHAMLLPGARSHQRHAPSATRHQN